MKPNDSYYECTGSPTGEDFFCSDSLSFELSKYQTYISDHRHYFDHKVIFCVFSREVTKVICQDI
jgi:hypothetical protein